MSLAFEFTNYWLCPLRGRVNNLLLYSRSSNFPFESCHMLCICYFRLSGFIKELIHLMKCQVINIVSNLLPNLIAVSYAFLREASNSTLQQVQNELL